MRHLIQNHYILLKSIANSFRYDFSSVETFCFFIGYPRSGHSLIGALLDAHPEIVISYELDVLEWIKKYRWINQSILFSLIVERSKWFANQKGSKSTGYSYAILKGYQGRYKNIRIIGDKKGGVSVKKLRQEPELMTSLANKIEVPMKIIHVIRNPFDNISTRYIRQASHSLGRQYEASDFNKESFEQFINGFDKDITTVEALKESFNYELIDIRQEDFVRNPKQTIKDICSFLNVVCENDYVDSCAKIVFDKPNKSRHKVPWNRDQINEVNRIIRKFDCLSGYSFES